MCPNPKDPCNRMLHRRSNRLLNRSGAPFPAWRGRGRRGAPTAAGPSTATRQD